MGTSHSKSTGIAIASLVALACTSSSGTPVVDATRPFSSMAFMPKPPRTATSRVALELRGGEDTTLTNGGETEKEKSLDEKVYAAMEKLGLSTPQADEEVDENGCKDGVCPVPGQTGSKGGSDDKPQESQDPVEIANRIAEDMSIDSYMAMAAIGATSILGDQNQRIFDESAARAMIQQELDLIAAIPEDSEYVQTLVGEGFDVFMSRRALAFSENNMEDARAILIADKMDAEEEKQEADLAASEAAAAAAAAAVPEDDFSFEPMAAAPSPSSSEPMAATTPTSAETTDEFVAVKADFDPTKLPASAASPSPAPATASDANSQMPKAARKEDVVFECTTEQIQELVLESPVPVLLDVYADWYVQELLIGRFIDSSINRSMPTKH